MEAPKIITGDEFFNSEQSLLIKNFNLSDEQLVYLQPLFEKLRYQSAILGNKLLTQFSNEFISHYEFIFKTINDNLIHYNQIEDKDTVDALNLFNAYVLSISEIIDKTRELVKTVKATFDIELSLYVSLFLELYNEIKHKNVNTSDTNQVLYQDNISKTLSDRISKCFSESVVLFSENFYKFYFQKIETILNKAELSTSVEICSSSNAENYLNPNDLIHKLEEAGKFIKEQINDFKSTPNNRFIDFCNNFEFQLELVFCEILKQPERGELISNNFAERSLEKVASVSDKIQKISDCFINEYALKVRLELIKIGVIKIFRQIHVELKKILHLNLGSKNQQSQKEIESLIQIFNQPKSSGLNRILNTTEKLDSNIYSTIENLINSSMHELSIILELLPERYEFAKNVFYSDFKLDSIYPIQFYKVQASKIGFDILNNHIKAFLTSENFSISNKINEIDNEIINQNKLIKFSIFKQDSNQLIQFDDNNKIDIEKFLIDEKQKAIGINSKIDNVLFTFEQAYIKLIDSTCNLLNINYFKDEAKYFRQYLPRRSSNKIVLNLRKFVNQIKMKYNRLIYYFWFHQSNAQILNDDIIEKQKAIPSVQRLLNTIEPLLLKKHIRDELPFYYKQLFLNNKTFNKEFWYGRQVEFERARVAYKRFLDGYNGALLVTGERYSGKSFMVNYFASQLINSGQIISIEAPVSGEADVKFLLKKMQEKTGFKGDFKKIFSSVEPGSIIIFDDLELWWEKSENGSVLIKQIINFIREYSHKLFFIASANIHSFKPMNSMLDIHYLFLDIINCKPVNAKSLQDIVLARHQITSLKFKLGSGLKISGKKDEALFVPKNYAQLFSKYYNFSNGNIGVCLHSWMANISGIEGGSIIMNFPKKTDLSEFDLLKENELLILYHLTIHKTMDINKLSRVLLSNENEIHEHLQLLKRLGLVFDTEQIFEINPFINHLIINILKKREML